MWQFASSDVQAGKRRKQEKTASVAANTIGYRTMGSFPIDVGV
jgi:hypothetical protein